ncbi:MAG: hypothetical protein M3203_03290 [Actinomycetota bacterium]|nr:hypothetical protein [Actinomycetota bacterium]
MTNDGGTGETLLTCARDGVTTRLQCTECGTPICPACYVRTSVGLRCPECGAASGPRGAAAVGRAGRWPLFAALAATMVVVAVVALAMAGNGGGGRATEPDLETAAAGGSDVVVGTGELPNGAPWTLRARRDGDLCTTFSVGGSPGPERCEPLVPGRHLIRTQTATVRGPSMTVYVTWGVVSERIEHVRVAPEGQASWDVPVVGAGSGLGVRFFVASVSDNVPVTFAALSAERAALDEQTRPAQPDR